MDFRLLRNRNYLGASLSQLLSGMAEIGLGVIFPLLLILNLTMDPALAGLALIPTTLPMIAVAPLAGRWYDRAGGRPPLVTGFALLSLSGVAMALAIETDAYLPLLPGLLLYGVGLSLVLTVNDPAGGGDDRPARRRLRPRAARLPGCRPQRLQHRLRGDVHRGRGDRGGGRRARRLAGAQAAGRARRAAPVSAPTATSVSRAY